MTGPARADPGTIVVSRAVICPFYPAVELRQASTGTTVRAKDPDGPVRQVFSGLISYLSGEWDRMQWLSRCRMTTRLHRSGRSTAATAQRTRASANMPGKRRYHRLPLRVTEGRACGFDKARPHEYTSRAVVVASAGCCCTGTPQILPLLSSRQRCIPCDADS